MRNESGNVLLADLLQQRNGHLRQPRIGAEAVLTAARQAHGRVGAAVHAVEDARVVPGQPDHDGTTAFDGDELLEVLHQMAIGQALDQGQRKHRIHLALLQHSFHTSHTVHFHNGIARTDLGLRMLLVPGISNAARYEEDGQHAPFRHEIHIHSQGLTLDFHQARFVHALRWSITTGNTWGSYFTRRPRLDLWHGFTSGIFAGVCRGAALRVAHGSTKVWKPATTPRFRARA
mmetsp:Transcript_27436/g.56647  ORF Transcript_27436/g.56647 Transcript_27436/m.56647 type:complete len:232 (-) Transcript_27436:14-709(-)